MSNPISRRDALKNLAMAAGALTAIPVVAADIPSMKPHVKMDDPTAIALAYNEDAGKVDAKAFATYKPGQMCSNCLQLAGKEGDTWRPCNLFPGKLVNAGGWCKVYLKKP
jgi:hypothetical protein